MDEPTKKDLEHENEELREILEEMLDRIEETLGFDEPDET